MLLSRCCGQDVCGCRMLLSGCCGQDIVRIVVSCQGGCYGCRYTKKTLNYSAAFFIDDYEFEIEVDTPFGLLEKIFRSCNSMFC